MLVGDVTVVISIFYMQSAFNPGKVKLFTNRQAVKQMVYDRTISIFPIY